MALSSQLDVKEIRGCKIKRYYTNRTKARKVAKQMNMRNKGGRIRAYKCFYCPGYHIGHISPSKRDVIEQQRSFNALQVN